MHLLLCISALLSLLFGFSLAVNEKFEIMKVNTLPALPYQESRPKHDGSYPLLLDTIMRLPQDINQHYFIRSELFS